MLVEVRVFGWVVGVIGFGFLVFVGMECGDDDIIVECMVGWVVGYRMFVDEQGRMNCSVWDIGGVVFLVFQFMLVVDIGKGCCLSFFQVVELGEVWCFCNVLVVSLCDLGLLVVEGEFGVDMQVSLVNDGLVIFIINL